MRQTLPVVALACGALSGCSMSSKDGSRAVLSEYATGIMTVARHFATACDALELPGHLAQRARTLVDEIEEIFSPVKR